MFRYNIIISVVVGAVGSYVMLAASRMPVTNRAGFGPGTWPMFLGGVLIALAAALLIETLAKRQSAPGAKPIAYTSPGLIGVYKLCALLGVFAFLLRFTNFLFASFVFIPAAMWVMGERRIKTLAGVAVGVPLSIYFVFAYLLKIALP